MCTLVQFDLCMSMPGDAIYVWAATMCTGTSDQCHACIEYIEPTHIYIQGAVCSLCIWLYGAACVYGYNARLYIAALFRFTFVDLDACLHVAINCDMDFSAKHKNEPYAQFLLWNRPTFYEMYAYVLYTIPLGFCSFNMPLHI